MYILYVRDLYLLFSFICVRARGTVPIFSISLNTKKNQVSNITPKNMYSKQHHNIHVQQLLCFVFKSIKYLQLVFRFYLFL